MTSWHSTALAFLLGVGSQMATAAPLVYDQPWNGASVAYASQTDTGSNGSFATMYDDFQLGTATNVSGVHWTGMFFSGPAAPIASFTVTFYADNSNQPGSALLTTTVAGDANQTALGSDAFAYDLDLTTAFAANADTRYWISIVPTLTFPPQWGTLLGTGGNGRAYQDFFGSRSALSLDLAFGLEGSAVSVPEPGALALTALSLLALGAVRRRKVNQA